MIAGDYQEVFEAVLAMQQMIVDLGVKEPTSFANLTRPAESFAEEVLLELHSERVAELIRTQPERASAFLSILGDIRAELSSVCVAPASPMTDVPKIHRVSAEAVLDAVRARRRRDGGYGGM